MSLVFKKYVKMKKQYDAVLWKVLLVEKTEKALNIWIEDQIQK